MRDYAFVQRWISPGNEAHAKTAKIGMRKKINFKPYVQDLFVQVYAKEITFGDTINPEMVKQFHSLFLKQ